MGGWTIAIVIAWFFVAIVGWFGLLVIGLAILMASWMWELDDQNAVPSYLTGSSHLYSAQYERQFSRSPEERESKRAAETELNRVLFIIRNIGIAMFILGLNLFIVHQL
jgi:hypothetical protein